MAAPDWYSGMFSNSAEIPWLLKNQNDVIGPKSPPAPPKPINALDVVLNLDFLGIGKNSAKDSASGGAGLPVISSNMPFADTIRNAIQGSGIADDGTAPGAGFASGVGDAIGSFVGRISIIILGLIFVAVGLMMFKPGTVVAVGQGLAEGAKDGLAAAG